MPSDPGKVTSELAAITDRAANELEKWRLTPGPSGGIHMSAHDVPRLAKAVEAVMAQHQPGPIAIVGALCARHADYRYFSITSTEAETITACPKCSAIVRVTCTGCMAFLDDCPTRKVITRELLREGGSDE